MRTSALFLVIAGVAAGLLADPVLATDQTILGKSISVKAKPGDASKTKISGSASEKNSPDTLVGDPTAAGSAGGAILTIFANGGSSTAQSFVLGQGTDLHGKPFWSGDVVKGFKYKDPKGAQGAVKSAQIKLSKNGSFSIKVSLTGKNGPITIAPPNPGTSACFAVQLGIDGTSGDRYSVQFGPESKIINKGDTLFKATKPVNEGVCPGGSPPTTTTTTSTTVPTTTTTTAPPTTTTTTAPPTTTTTSTTVPTTTTTTAPPTTTTTTAPPTTTTTTTTVPTTTTTAPPTTTTTTAPPTTTTTSTTVPTTTTTAPPTTTTTTAPPTTTTTTSTTSTTLGSPSGAFLDASDGAD